ncbi:MAG: hypothetical protein ABSA30_13995, partial [Candidatus Aminicenantales bacterium]
MMKFCLPSRAYFWIIVFGALLAALTPPAPAQGLTAPPAGPAFDVKAVENLIAERIQAGDLVGVSLAAARDGKIILSGGYGRARVDDNRPVTPET